MYKNAQTTKDAELSFFEERINISAGWSLLAFGARAACLLFGGPVHRLFPKPLIFRVSFRV